MVCVVGVGVLQWCVGDEVFGMVGGVGGYLGMLVEFVVVDVWFLVCCFLVLVLCEVVVFLFVFIIVWEGLVDCVCVSVGYKVLVYGGVGGVGQMVVQLVCL